MYLNLITFCIGILLSANLVAEEYEPPTMSAEELENYQFSSPADEQEMEVDDLSIGQRFVMSRQRTEVEELVARHLGIVKLRGNSQDLVSLQQLVEKKVLRDDQTETWQAMGVVMGDLMAEEFDLHWVQVEDEFGVSKALQWEDTTNFVFPITLLSKRIKFGEKIDIPTIYAKLSADIERFKEYERTHPKLKLPGGERLTGGRN
jgi:hypothetical protein